MKGRSEPEMLLVFALLSAFATVANTLVTSPVIISAFVRLSFEPHPLTLHRNERGIVCMTATVDDVHVASTSHLPMELHMRTMDPSVASVSAAGHRLLLASAETRFNLTAIGREVGRTRVAFFLSGNASSGDNATLLHEWRLPPDDDLQVVVRNPHNYAEVYMNALALLMVGVNLVGIGGQVDSVEVVYLVKRPLSLAVGLVCRFGIMPAVSTEALTPGKC